jgi:hypothetical protein
MSPVAEAKDREADWGRTNKPLHTNDKAPLAWPWGFVRRRIEDYFFLPEALFAK